MNITSRDILEQFIASYHELAVCKDSIEKAFMLLKDSFSQGGKVLVCGNGGSAADSDHIVGELMKGFLLKRPVSNLDREKLKNLYPEDGDYLSDYLQGALPAISLTNQSALMTAFANDVAADMQFAQQVYGYGRKGDVLIGISTSGNASNVINAAKVAKAFGVNTIGLTGKDGGRMNSLCDVMIKAPQIETYKIQEYHLPIYHSLCAMIELEFFAD